MEGYIFYFFFILMGIVIIEMILSATWNHFYFSKGLTIFEIGFTKMESNFSQQYIYNLKTNAEHYHGLDDFNFQLINDTLIGFREKMFDFSFFKLRYSPIMHGSIVFDRNKNLIIVKGTLNCFFSAFIIYWYVFIISINLINTSSQKIEMIPFLVFPLILTVVILFIQIRRFKKIAEIVKVF